MTGKKPAEMIDICKKVPDRIPIHTYQGVSYGILELNDSLKNVGKVLTSK